MSDRMEVVIITTSGNQTVYLTQQEKNDLDLQMDDETAQTVDVGTQMRLLRDKVVGYLDAREVEKAAGATGPQDGRQVNPRDPRDLAPEPPRGF